MAAGRIRIGHLAPGQYALNAEHGSYTLSGHDSNLTYAQAGEALFHDDFASGDLTHADNSINWLGTRNTAVVAYPSNPSGFALRFRFNTPNPGNFAEQRFSLGTLRTELWIQFKCVIPANYNHTDNDVPVTTDNNKFFRLWSGDTSDGNNGYGDYYLKQGYSTRVDSSGLGESAIAPDWGVMDSGGSVSGVDDFGAGITQDFITSGFYGEEVTFTMHFKVDTSGAGVGADPQPTGGNGIQRIWRDGTLIRSNTTVRATPGMGTNGWLYGYIWGATNSAAWDGEEIVDFYVTEFTVAETDIFGVS